MKSLKIKETDLPKSKESKYEIPTKLNVTGYIWKRLAELEGNIPDDQICGMISRELEAMGHDSRRARRILPPKYKVVDYISYKNRH